MKGDSRKKKPDNSFKVWTTELLKDLIIAIIVKMIEKLLK